MDNHKKLALADLMARAEQRKQDKKTFKSVYFHSLGGELTFERIPLTRALAFSDGLDEDKLVDNLEANIDLIYQCCPMMRNRELQEAYDCKEPTDIVCALFEDNLNDISYAAQEILAFYGMRDIKDDVKN